MDRIPQGGDACKLSSRRAAAVAVAVGWILTTASAAPVGAVKEIVLPAPVHAAVNPLKCAVCRQAVVQAASECALLPKLKRTREESVLHRAVETVCRPFTPPGSWLRLVRWRRDAGNRLEVSFTPGAATAGVVDGSGVGANFKCGPECSSAASACDAILDRATDPLARSLVRASKRRWAAGEADVDEYEHSCLNRAEARETQQRACAPFCATEARPLPPAAATWVASDWTPRVPLPDKEREIEEMLFRMRTGVGGKRRTAAEEIGGLTGDGGADAAGTDDGDDESDGDGGMGGPGLDVFSRDEMYKLQDAMRRGDRSALAELDPTSSDLTDEEFEMLSAMYGGKNAHAGK